MYKLEFTESALNDLDFFRKFEQVIILNMLEKQLVTEPLTSTRNRKQLDPSDLAEWELRVAHYRAFYDVDMVNQKVRVKAIGSKKHNQLYIRGKEYFL